MPPRCRANMEPETFILAFLLLILFGMWCMGCFSWIKLLTTNTLGIEICGDKWITPKMSSLQVALRSRVHGQPFLYGTVVAALGAHLHNPNPPKALVLSFHGVPGIGKTFASSIIAEHLYKRGHDSGFVHFFVTPKHFPHSYQLQQYQDQLRDWIVGNVTACERSLFIFDEVDKQPPGLMDAVMPFLDYYPTLDGINYRKSIFIFLSNSGGHAIAHQTDEKLQRGEDRDEFSPQDRKKMEDLIKSEAYSIGGGLQRTAVIDKHLVSLFVPFLPLERVHVQRCIEDDLRKTHLDITEHVVTKVADELSYFPENTKRFSKTGCKGVHDRVALITHMAAYQEL